jgi:osmotically-inducible protein OsmY
MSDRQLERGIVEFLKTRRLDPVRPFHVEARDGVVTVRGAVATGFAKRACYECCRHVAGVRRVVDEVEVAI